MGYSTPVDTGTDQYICVMKHNNTGLIVEVKMDSVDPSFPAPTRAVKDAVFQGVVDKLSSISGATMIAARRSLNYGSDITPTP